MLSHDLEHLLIAELPVFTDSVHLLMPCPRPGLPAGTWYAHGTHHRLQLRAVKQTGEEPGSRTTGLGYNLDLATYQLLTLDRISLAAFVSSSRMMVLSSGWLRGLDELPCLRKSLAL